MSEEAIRSVCGPKLLVRYEELSLKTVPQRNTEIRVVNTRFKRLISHVHVPNLMQMSENNRFSVPLNSAQAKFEV